MTRELQWLRRVRDVCHLLAKEQEPSKLLPLILDAAIELTEAERGFLVLLGTTARGTLKIKVEVARGFDRYSLRGGPGAVSRTVVQRVVERERGLVTSAETDKDLLEKTSVADRRVLSILCVPLSLRGGLRGVVYLDHRFKRGAFSEDDLPVLQAFADHAALALETAELARASAPAPKDESTDAEDAASSTTSLVQLGGLLGASDAMQGLYRQVEIAARSWDPVLILGEEGCGQELVAREIHVRSERGDAPFVAVRCGSIADSALGGLLAGRDAPSGEDRPLLERVGGGTLFLDELDRLPRPLQDELLGLLNRRAGVACRFVVAARPEMRAQVEAGEFRPDLYYRLDVMRVAIPPLRSRPDDIPTLYAHFARAAKGRAPTLSSKALELLVSYSWPGNVAELREESVRLVSTGRARISARQLSARIQEGRGVSRAVAGFAGKTLAEVEREVVAGALRDSGGNKAQAARDLGIARGSLYHLLRRHGLE